MNSNRMTDESNVRGSLFLGSEVVPFNLSKDLSTEELYSLVFLWRTLKDNGGNFAELDLAQLALKKILSCLPGETLYELEKQIDESIE